MANDKVNIQLYPYSYRCMSNNASNINNDNVIDSCDRFVKYNIDVNNNYNFSRNDDDDNDVDDGGRVVPQNVKNKNNYRATSPAQRTRSKPITFMASSAKTPTP